MIALDSLKTVADKLAQIRASKEIIEACTLKDFDYAFIDEETLEILSSKGFSSFTEVEALIWLRDTLDDEYKYSLEWVPRLIRIRWLEGNTVHISCPPQIAELAKAMAASGF